jgi:hypothetical protein
MRRVLIIGPDGQVKKKLTPPTTRRRVSAVNRSGVRGVATPAALPPEFDAVLETGGLGTQ